MLLVLYLSLRLSHHIVLYKYLIKDYSHYLIMIWNCSYQFAHHLWGTSKTVEAVCHKAYDNFFTYMYPIKMQIVISWSGRVLYSCFSRMQCQHVENSACHLIYLISKHFPTIPFKHNLIFGDFAQKLFDFKKEDKNNELIL